MNSAYGSVADTSNAIRSSPDYDPWDQLRLSALDRDAGVQSAQRLAAAAAKERATNAKFRPRIRSKSHPLISHCRRISREQARKKEGVMRIEGLKLIRAALELDWRPDVVLAAPQQAAELAADFDWLDEENVLVVGTPDAVGSALLQPRLDPALAVGPPPRLAPRRRPEHAMLLGVQDPNNLGSLIRTGAALGVTTTYLLPNTPDPFNPMVIRASAGAALMMEYGTEEQALANGLPVLCADAHLGGQVPARGFDGAAEPFMLALGHESRGLPEEWLDRGHIITLPVHIESLGVAAAGAILLDRLLCNYEAPEDEA